jgi:mRNA interferase MazF
MADPLRGEVWLGDLGPTRGHEESGKRPLLIFSVDSFNTGPAGLVVVLPLTSRLRGVPAHILVNPPEGGLRRPSVVLCDAIRSVTKDCLIDRWGDVTPTTMAKVEDTVRLLLGL